jgi:hypothetical protein
MSHTHKFTTASLTSELRRKIEQRQLEKDTWLLCKRILEELEEMDRKYRRVLKGK